MAKSVNPRINSKITFEWNAPYSVILNNLGFGKPLNLETAKIFYKWYRPYVPWKTGKLTKWVHFNSTKDHGTITHYAYAQKTPTSSKFKYSHYQYTIDEGNPFGDVLVHRTRTEHRYATSHWAEWAWSLHKKDITADIQEARKKYRKPTKGKSK